MILTGSSVFLPLLPHLQVSSLPIFIWARHSTWPAGTLWRGQSQTGMFFRNNHLRTRICVDMHCTQQWSESQASSEENQSLIHFWLIGATCPVALRKISPINCFMTSVGLPANGPLIYIKIRCLLAGVKIRVGAVVLINCFMKKRCGPILKRCGPILQYLELRPFFGCVWRCTVHSSLPESKALHMQNQILNTSPRRLIGIIGPTFSALRKCSIINWVMAYIGLPANGPYSCQDPSTCRLV